MIGSFRCFSIKKSKKQLQQSLSKSSIYTVHILFRSSHQRCSLKKAVHKNFAIFTGKHLQVCNVFKKRLQHRCLPVNNAKFLRKPILKDMQTAASQNLSSAALLIFNILEIAVCQRFTKQVFLKYLQNSQEGTFASLFWIKFQTFRLKIYQIKDSIMDIFPKFCKIFKNTFFTGLLHDM